MYLRRQEKQQDSARDAFYRMYSTKEYTGQPDTNGQKALYEAAKHFFERKRTLGPVVAFKRCLNESVKPEWLMWAVTPALNQLDYRDLMCGVRVAPVAPPWSKK